MLNDNYRQDVAVFIDFENVYVSVRDKLDANPNFEMIMDRCEDLGRVVIARAYADWYRYPRVTSALYANSIEPMYVPTYYYDRDMGRTGRAIKNSVDMNLCIDAMKTLFINTNIAKFVLVTGDRDFIPLVNSIRQQGKEVIIIGVGGAASTHLAQSADEFIFYEQLVGKKVVELPKEPARSAVRPSERGRDDLDEEQRTREPSRERDTGTPEVYDILVKAIHLARERGYVCSFGSLKLLMKELMGGDFKEGKYKDPTGRPFAKFKDFVLEAERRGKVQVFTSGTVNEVFLPGEDPYQLSQFAQDLKEDPRTPLLEAPPEVIAEPRIGASNNGRRRRRRPRGSQRTAHVLPVEPDQVSSDSIEDLETIEYSLPSDVLDLITQNNFQDDTIFDTLLERVEEEEAEIQALAALDPLDLLDFPPPGEQQSEEGTDEHTDTTADQAGQPLTDEEWQVLQGIMQQTERPLSFVQIHDALREARNSIGLNRTNEELRSLIKHAINNGLLARSGKGNRVTYRLAPPPPEKTASETHDEPGIAERLVGATPDQVDQIESASRPSIPVFEFTEPIDIAPFAVASNLDLAPSIAEEQESYDAFQAPEADVEVAQELAAPQITAPTLVAGEEPQQEIAQAAPSKGRSRKKKAQETSEPAAPKTPAKPTRTRRKKTETIA